MLPSVACCVVLVVTNCDGSSVRTLMTLLTESGEDTPLESLSMSSVSGLNSSRDKRRGKGRAKGSGRPTTITDDRRTNGKGFLTAAPPANRASSNVTDYTYFVFQTFFPVNTACRRSS